MLSQSQAPLLTNEEWIADGWEITSRETYTISDYVEPYSVTENGISEYFIELCFTEEGEFRAGIAGENRAVFISESGSIHSMEIPDYSDISLFPHNNFAVTSKCVNMMNGEWEHFFVDAKNQTITQINLLRPIFSWIMDMDGHVVGIGGLTLAFYATDGNLIHLEEYQYDIVSTIVQWAYSGDNVLVVMNLDELAIIAYDMLGNKLWETIPEISTGTVPLAVSSEGRFTVAFNSPDGCILLNEHGSIIDYFIKGNLALSLAVSPNGDYVASSSTPLVEQRQRGLPELAVFNVQNRTSTQIEIDSEYWLPSVRSISDDGTLLCGYKLIDGYNDWDISGQRLVLYDNAGNTLWATKIYRNNVIRTNAIDVYTYSRNINLGFTNCINLFNGGYQLSYLDLISGKITIFNINAN